MGKRHHRHSAAAAARPVAAAEDDVTGMPTEPPAAAPVADNNGDVDCMADDLGQTSYEICSPVTARHPNKDCRARSGRAH